MLICLSIAYNVTCIALVALNYKLKLDKMKEFTDYLERMIEGCDSLGDMEREKAVYQSVLKHYKKQLALCNVVGQSEQLPQNLCTLNENTCDKGSGCKYPHCHL